MAGPSSTVDQNLLPVQAYFDVYGNFQTFIGQGQPFYAKVNPIQSGLTITNSTLDSSPIGSFVPSTGVFTNISTTTGQVTTTPVNANDIANKFYVDTVAQGLGPKAACQCATTAPITLSGLQTIDGYTTLAGDRVLVKNESSSQFNGIYIASSGAWTRSSDMDVWSEVPGAYTVILNGGQAETGWVCTATATGTINVTAMPWVQFSGSNTYYAGTGLSLSANTFSIANTGVTAGSYGSASNTLSATVNAQGQLTALSATAIAIAASQITSGTIASSLISGSYTGITGVGTLTAGTWNATPITNSYLANSSITINGNAVSLGGSTTVTANTPNSLTFNNGGTGAASGTTFNGSVAQTISYNTIGAPSTTGTGASGTWGISVTGNAGTVTNGVYITSSYSNPSWITSILGSIVSGAVASATLATTATNIAGGATGSLPYQSATGTTSFLSLGTTNYVLTAGASAPQYVAQSTLSVGSATTATTATNLAGGGAGYIPYQSGSGATSFLSAGTTGQVLTSNGTGAPTWTTPTSYATVTDDTTTNATRYPLFANQTTGNLTTEYTSSTKYQFNPSTGVLTATGFSGSGASLTSLTAGNLSGTIPSGVLGNSSLYIGTTAVPLNAASGSITSLAVNISGSASSATTATTATNANNVAVTDNTSSSATWYPTLVSTTTGNLPITTSSTKLSFVPSTGVLSANGVPLTGNLGTVTSVSGTGSVNGITLTGTVTSSGSLTLGGTLSGIGNSQLTNSSITIGGTAVSLGGTVGTLGVAYGGTGLTSLTAGYIPYGNGSSAFSSSSSFSYNGTSLTAGNFVPGSSTIPTNGLFLSTTNTLGFAINSAEAMRIDANGNLGLGVSSIAGNTTNRVLNVQGSDSANLVVTRTGNESGALYAYAGYIWVGSSTNHPFIFTTNGTERMRLDTSGNLGLGTSSPNASAILDAQSTTKGVRMPNMTTTQKNAISSPAAGLIVFDTTLAKLCVYSGAAWQTITSI